MHGNRDWNHTHVDIGEDHECKAPRQVGFSVFNQNDLLRTLSIPSALPGSIIQVLEFRCEVHFIGERVQIAHQEYLEDSVVSENRAETGWDKWSYIVRRATHIFRSIVHIWGSLFACVL